MRTRRAAFRIGGVVVALLAGTGGAVRGAEAAATGPTRPITDPAGAVARVVAAAEGFERAFSAKAGLGDTVVAAVDLVKTIDAALPKARADALVAGIADFYVRNGGYQGYATLMLLGPAERRAMLREKAEPEWRAALDGLLAVQPGKWHETPQWAERLKAWPARARGERGPSKASGVIERARVLRAALGDGDFGAFFDLGYTALNGHDTAVDGDLFRFWLLMARATDRARFEVIAATPDGTPASYRALAEAGCRWGMFQLAMSQLPNDRTVVPPGEARTLLERAAAAGYPRARATLSERTVREVAGSVEPVALPRLDLAQGGRLADGRRIADSPDYTTEITRMEQLAPIFERAKAGVARGLAEFDAAAVVEHVAGWNRVWSSALALAQREPALRLPDLALGRELAQRARAAWQEGWPGTAVFAWVVHDSLVHHGGKLAERESAPGATWHYHWAVWRSLVHRELGRVMPAVGAGAWPTQGPVMPAWSPVVRHPVDVFFGRAVPVLEAGYAWPLQAPKINQMSRLHPVPAEVRVVQLAASAPAEPAAVQGGIKRQVEVRRLKPNAAFAEQTKARAERLAMLPKAIAALEPRIAKEAMTETTTSSRDIVGYETQTTTRQAMPFDRPGVSQGSTVVTGSVRMPVYQNNTRTIRTRNEQHPLVKEQEKLKRELAALKNGPAPKEFTEETAVERTVFDRWRADAVVAVRITMDETVRPVRLVVPMVHEVGRGGMGPPTADAVGAAVVRQKVARPMQEGAPEVYRAAAVWLLQEKLTASAGAPRAAWEAALVAELVAGFEPDDGGVVGLIRERMGAGTRAASFLMGPMAPELAFLRPVPHGAKPSATPPAGVLRLVHDPAVEREASALERRFTAAGAKVSRVARTLPRTTPVHPVLAMATEGKESLGTFVWHVAPEQLVALHKETGVPPEELRLHAPVEPVSLANGEVWILAHPSRVEEARAIERKFTGLTGQFSLIETLVGRRGVQREGRPARTVLAPDPESRWLAELLRRSGLDEVGPIEPLRLPARLGVTPDLVIVLRAEADAAPRGLSAEDVRELGAGVDTFLSFANGKRTVVEAAKTESSSLALW